VVGEKVTPKIGVLAFQGSYEAHQKSLKGLGVTVDLVRKHNQLKHINGLIIPGGESTTILKFLEEKYFWEILIDFVHKKPCLGTCAGAILLAKNVENPLQKSLGAIDITIERNAYGRQLQSKIRHGKSLLGNELLEQVFIRAPRIKKIGSNVEILAEDDGDPVWVRQDQIMVTTFHPELSSDDIVYSEFLKNL
jgi:5'-phosphate synthase pdxT subunit